MAVNDVATETLDVSEPGTPKRVRPATVVMSVVASIVVLSGVFLGALSLLGETVSANACAWNFALGDGPLIETEEEGRAMIEEMREMNCMGLEYDIAVVESAIAALE